jgi:hypothetical protein
VTDFLVLLFRLAWWWWERQQRRAQREVMDTYWSDVV